MASRNSDNKRSILLGEDISKPSALLNGKNYLLIIAIDDYRNGIPPLYNAVKDAQDFRKLLLEQFRFEESLATSLFNEAATQDAILDAFDHIERQLTEADNFVFYFAGHGWYHKERETGYWLPYDAVLKKRSTYLNNADVVATFRTSKARHVFGIVDACFSASLFVQQRSLGTEEMRYFNLPSRWLLTSGQVEPVSDGSAGQNSPFAQALITQLKYHTAPAVSISELWVNMRKAVVANAQQTPRCEPLQNAGHQNGEFFLIRKGATPAQAEPLILPSMATREVLPPPPPELPSATITAEELKGLPLEEIQDQLEELAATNELEQALGLLKAILSRKSSARQALILINGRFNRNRKQEMSGLAKEDDVSLAYRQVSHSLLELIRGLKERDLNK